MPSTAAARQSLAFHYLWQRGWAPLSLLIAGSSAGMSIKIRGPAVTATDAGEWQAPQVCRVLAFETSPRRC
jgi:hypothetical protein